MSNSQEKYNKIIPLLIGELNERLIERDELAKLVILAICSHSHMFLIGERGVAKSMTVEMINTVIEKSTYWQLQVNEDTGVDELFGIKKADKQGAMQYVSKNSILNTNIAVLDEMFKARGELLNAMLELLVDGAYTSGDGKKRQTPLISVFATGNEYPTETYMLPYVDRFTIWFEVKRIQSIENRKKFYSGQYNKKPISKHYLSIEDLYTIKDEASKIEVLEEIIDIYEEITSSFVRQAVKTSDRKYNKTLDSVMKTCAYLNNRNELDISDIFLLLHTSWHDEHEKSKVRRVVFEKIFGVKEDIEKEIIRIKSSVEEIDTYKNNHLYEFLNFKKEITGANKNKFFDQLLANVTSVWNAYKAEERAVITLENKYQRNLMIEKLLENNIFTMPYKQNSFTEKILFELKKSREMLLYKLTPIEEWYSLSDTFFKYQTIFHERSKL